MAAGVFGYLGYDMVRLMEELPPPNPDPIGIPDAILIRPTVVVVFDAVKDTHHRGDAGAAASRASPPRRRSRAPPSGSPAMVDALDRPLDKARRRDRRRPARRRRRSRTPRRPNTRRWCAQAKEYIAGRRHLPGGAVAALRGAVHAAAVRALPRAAPGQSGAVPVLPRLRRLRRRRLEPGNPGARARRHRDDPPDRRHAAARRRRRTRTRRWRTSCSPIRRSAPST